ncbi:MAG: hypothetical protein CMO55_00935 [Verrucomicrobiales bacterium]|nr:hypothetical protein [Verrucomicrobiales bacterium]
MNDSEDVQRLIRLKRYETPGEEYFARFREELKDHQRAEMLKSSSRSLVVERIGLWLKEVNEPRWVLPAGATAAAAAVAAGLFVVVPKESENAPASYAQQPGVSPEAPRHGIVPTQYEESFEITLPKPDQSGRVPELSSGSGASGLFPVSAKYREL